jgi:predicted ArsR family transcriptional regulator
MQYTRKLILAYLEENRIGTSFDLSRALMVTPANIRHHLKLLKEARLVDVVGVETKSSRGRPKKLYCLTNTALKQNLSGLASALLQTVKLCGSDAGYSLSVVVDNLIGDFQVDENDLNKLNRAVEKLNSLKYNGAWEASPYGPRIILRNCPYAKILTTHPELCEFDSTLIARLLNTPVKQTAKLERSLDGSPHCAFITVVETSTSEGLSKN